MKARNLALHPEARAIDILARCLSSFSDHLELSTSTVISKGHPKVSNNSSRMFFLPNTRDLRIRPTKIEVNYVNIF